MAVVQMLMSSKLSLEFDADEWRGSDLPLGKDLLEGNITNKKI